MAWLELGPRAAAGADRGGLHGWSRQPISAYDTSMPEYGDDVPHDPAPLTADEHTGTGTRIRAAMGSAEALSVAALLVAALPLTSSLGSQLFAWITWESGGAGLRDSVLFQVTSHGVFGLITVVLAGVAIARTDAFTPSWVRGISGGAVTFGLIEIAVTVIATVPPLVA